MWAHMDRPITPVPIQPTLVVDGLIGLIVVVVVEDMVWVFLRRENVWWAGLGRRENLLSRRREYRSILS